MLRQGFTGQAGLNIRIPTPDRSRGQACAGMTIIKL